MATTKMMPIEFLAVSSTILIGAILGHFALLSLCRRFKGTPVKTVSVHGIYLCQQSDDELVSAHSTSYAEKSPLKVRSRRTASSRGVITGLPSRHSPVSKGPWARQDREIALHEIVMAVHHENPRSTYLGADTFDKVNPSAQLFGWHRTPGRPTVELGHVAHVVKQGDEVGLQVVLHPDDAKMVTGAGWGTRVDSSSRNKSVPVSKNAVTVMLKAPRSQLELEEATKVVLNAAVWYVVGLDREENV